MWGSSVTASAACETTSCLPAAETGHGPGQLHRTAALTTSATAIRSRLPAMAILPLARVDSRFRRSAGAAPGSETGICDSTRSEPTHRPRALRPPTIGTAQCGAATARVNDRNLPPAKQAGRYTAAGSQLRWIRSSGTSTRLTPLKLNRSSTLYTGGSEDTCCRIVPRAFCTFWLNETPWITRPDRSTVTRSFGWNMSPPRIAREPSRDPWYTRPGTLTRGE